uniref:Uncharacterized protein n=1 Tax=Salix viminalis TaxID=40686 RepID=A0A6N2M7K9_SALVM
MDLTEHAHLRHVFSPSFRLDAGFSGTCDYELKLHYSNKGFVLSEGENVLHSKQPENGIKQLESCLCLEIPTSEGNRLVRLGNVLKENLQQLLHGRSHYNTERRHYGPATRAIWSIMIRQEHDQELVMCLEQGNEADLLLGAWQKMNVFFNLWFLIQKPDLIKPPSPSFLSFSRKAQNTDAVEAFSDKMAESLFSYKKSKSNNLFTVVEN